MTDFWQAPGNGKGFDSFLGDGAKMNNRTIGALSYIRENSLEDGFVTQAQFIDEIKSYLLEKFQENPNESLGSHFYRPALFYGFLHINADNKISLSIEGNLFLNAYEKEDYLSCQKLIINQLDNTIYPNSATQKIKELKLFPFRILFKLLLDKRELSSSFISETLVHIKTAADLSEYERTKELSAIASSSNASGKYLKFNTWVVNSLVDLKILILKDKKLSIHGDVLNHIVSLYENVNFSYMFFNETSCSANEKIAQIRVQRDATLIQKAKERDAFVCQVDANHATFTSKGNNYVEGHHVIPMFQQKNYAFKLDDVDNVSSLCPNCHREIHSSDDKTQILQKLYNLNKTYMSANSIDLRDLYKMYSCA